MTTAAPTTLAPTTAVPTTVAPTTIAPTTVVTTVGPTTVGTTLSPTTLATTVAPTTTLTTAAPTTTLTTMAPTTAHSTYISAGVTEISLSAVNTLSVYPIPESNPALDLYIWLDPIEINISSPDVTGPGLGILAGPTNIVLSARAELIISPVISAGPTNIYLTSPDIIIASTPPKTNWVKWSKIGYLDFTIDESNVAGEMPLNFRGNVYAIKKLFDKVIVYGQDGITSMSAHGISYGLDRVMEIGIAGKNAVVGTEYEHFFIDIYGRLYKFDKNFIKLDYSEYLSQMTNPVMSIDVENRLVYICDGTYGFVYSIDSNSFGKCAPNITGFGQQVNTTYVVGDGEIVPLPLEICTDIYDFGTRKPKTITFLSLGTDVTQHLYSSIDYRLDYKGNFNQIGWFLVNPDGKTFPKCYGVEFRFRFKSKRYEYFEIDYIKVRGVVHGYSYLDYASEVS